VAAVERLVGRTRFTEWVAVRPRDASCKVAAEVEGGQLSSPAWIRSGRRWCVCSDSAAALIPGIVCGRGLLVYAAPQILRRRRGSLHCRGVEERLRPKMEMDAGSVRSSADPI